jgi:hypothetical protein
VLLLQVLRHLLVQHPPRAATQKEIDRVNRAIEKITAEGKKIAAIMQVGYPITALHQPEWGSMMLCFPTRGCAKVWTSFDRLSIGQPVVLLCMCRNGGSSLPSCSTSLRSCREPRTSLMSSQMQ